MGVAQKNLKVYKVIKLIKSKRFNLFLQFLLVLVIILNVGSIIWNLRNKYLSMNYWQNFSSLEKIFLDSQYVNKNPPGWIPDETAFSYAGGKLIKGENPVLVVPDAPPLGKYIIGLSTIIFNNDSTFILVGALLSLILLYILSFQIFANKILSIIPSLLLSFEPIFKNQLIYTPLMDIFQLFFLLCIFIFFNKGISNEKSFLYFFLGFFIATKFFITGFPIIVAYYIVLFFVKDKKKIINLTLTLPLALFILLLSYARVFAFGYTINKFLGIQKWVYLYHKSYLILPLSVWPLLLLNKWHVWFGDKPIIQDAQWSFTWPIITIASIITIILYILGKIPKNKNLEILMAWFVVYMLFLSVGQIFSRYFVILIPILYVISLYGVISIYKIYKK